MVTAALSLSQGRGPAIRIQGSASAGIAETSSAKCFIDCGAHFIAEIPAEQRLFRAERQARFALIFVIIWKQVTFLAGLLVKPSQPFLLT